MNYIIVDLEATCWERGDLKPTEIIEIGAVCVDATKNVLGEIDLFVRPKVHSQLSSFCTDLTSITQDDVNDAPFFPEALEHFLRWVKSFGNESILCSWGFYDRTQLESDCRLHKLNADFLHHHISLKHQYAKIKNIKPAGMKTALQMENMKLEGKHHRALDDAKNVAKIFLRYFEEWEMKR